MSPRSNLSLCLRLAFGACVLLGVATSAAFAGEEPAHPTGFEPGAYQGGISIPRVEYRIEAGYGLLAFSNSDMSDDYGVLPSARIGLTTSIGRNNEFLFAIGYGKRSTELETGDATFRGSTGIELETIPVIFGIRTNLTGLQFFRMNVGAAVQISRLQETAPYFSTYPYFEGGVSEDVGWGRQLLLTMGPEWRWSDGRFAMGAEFGASLGGGNVDSQYDRDVSLEGFSGRIYGSWRIGVHEEKTGEVLR